MRQSLIVLLACLWLLPSAAASARAILAATPIARLDLPWWRARHNAKIRELAMADPRLIFLGDSITQNWEHAGPPDWQDFSPSWQRFYGDRRAVNLGFKGDTTASLLWRIRNGEVADIAPRAAVVLIGANNMGRLHWSAEDTVAGIDAVITELHRRLPDTKILLLAVLPSQRSEWVTRTTAQVNRMLTERYAHDQSLTFLDLTRLFVRNGTLNRDMFLDGRLRPPDPLLHPTAQAQAQMAAAIDPVLAKLLGDKPHL